MSENIIDMSAVIAKRNSPDEDKTCIGIDGLKYYEYSCDYEYNQSFWSFSIWATSQEDAVKRLQSIKLEKNIIPHQILTEGPILSMSVEQLLEAAENSGITINPTPDRG